MKKRIYFKPQTEVVVINEGIIMDVIGEASNPEESEYESNISVMETDENDHSVSNSIWDD